MKKIVSLLLMGFICCNLLGSATQTYAQDKEVAVIWDTKSLMVTDVLMGFLPQIKRTAPNLRIAIFRELKDMEEAKRVFQECESKMNGIVFLRSSGAQYLAQITPKVPCFVGACNNPAELGLIKNLDAPEGMVTGVTYFIPYDKRFDIIMKLFPEVKSLALLVEKGHPSGPIERNGTREECSRRGIIYKDVVATNLGELIRETKALGKVDLILISNTRLVMDNIVSILGVANANKTPLFSFASKPVTSGAVAGLAADDVKLGAMLADSVADVVVRGKSISQVPVKMDSDPRIIINERMMRGLGLKFPETILQKAEIIR